MINLSNRLKNLESSYDFYYYLSGVPSEEHKDIFKNLRDSLPTSDNDTDIFDDNNYLIICWQVGKKTGGNCWNQNKHFYEKTDNVIPPLYLVFSELKGNEIASIAAGSSTFHHTKHEYYGNESDYISMVIPTSVIDWIYEFALDEIVNWGAFL